MKSIKSLGKIILILVGIGVALFAGIQLIPYGRDHTNPPIIQEPDWDTNTRTIARRACFDCHSNETIWPWYSNIAPFSWLIQRDVEEGRDNLNFSDWDGKNADEIGEMVAEDEMPPAQYLLMHPEARLSEADKQALIQAFGR